MRKELFEKLLESVKQAKAIEKTELKPSRMFMVNPGRNIVKTRSKRRSSGSRVGRCDLAEDE